VLKAVFSTEYLRADQLHANTKSRKKFAMSQTPSANPQRSVIHLLRRVDQCAAQLYTTESADNDLTLRQLAIMTAISRQENLSQTDLVTITGIDRSTVAGIVSRLIRKGLLERKRSPLDGRAYCVRLSKRGAKAVLGADRLYTRVEKKLLASVPAAEATKFVSTLRTILSAHADEEQSAASA
jgi:DNA-binding MarR family transcriptional regulator